MSKSEKLSFSLSSKPKPSSSSRSNNNNNNSFGDGKPQKEDEPSQPQYVTEFDASKTLTPQPKIVIPPKENTWNFHKKKMSSLNFPLPSEDTSLRFELENPSSVDDSKSDMSYGLNLRSNDNGEKKSDPNSVPNSVEDLLLQKLRDELNDLPDDRGLDEFKDVPIDGFGAALLAGYGWSEGRGIGRNHKEDVQVPQYLRRAEKEGLGFIPESHDMNQKQKRGGGHPSDPPLVAPKDSDGRTRHVVGIDEKLVPRESKGVFVGKVVRVVDGRHVGLKGKVLKMLGSSLESQTVALKLLKSGEEVSVGLNVVAELGSVEEEKCLRKLQEVKTRRKDDDRRDSSSRSHREKRDDDKEDVSNGKRRRRDEELERDKKASHLSNRDGGRREERASPVSWLTSHIRVRIICKEFKGGKLYLKKGEVMDVVGPTTCDISMDMSNELIQGVDQKILETALPKRGGPVLVLHGRHKGVFGKLVESDKEREIGLVQDADTHKLLEVRLEQIAEYIGDPSDLGY